MEFIRRNVMNWYEKGIKIKDREYAEEMLRQIGYFPLMGGYKHLFRISNTKKYKAGTSFEEIVSLYKFDAELRELFFKYLLQIERQMRSLMSYYFTEMYGAEQKQYLDANNYNNTKRNHAAHTVLRCLPSSAISFRLQAEEAQGLPEYQVCQKALPLKCGLVPPLHNTRQDILQAS